MKFASAFFKDYFVAFHLDSDSWRADRKGRGERGGDMQQALAHGPQSTQRDITR